MKAAVLAPFMTEGDILFHESMGIARDAGTAVLGESASRAGDAGGHGTSS